jgi:hypothetical protein
MPSGDAVLGKRLSVTQRRLLKAVLLAFIFYYRLSRPAPPPRPREEQLVVGGVLTLVIAVSAALHPRFGRSRLVYAAALVCCLSYAALVLGLHQISVGTAYLVPLLYVAGSF